MSYILEALKKSDEERNRGSAPGIQTVQTSVLQVSKRRYWWIYLLALALLLNAGLLAWWLGPWKSANKENLQTSAQPQSQPEVVQPAKDPGNAKAGTSGKAPNTTKVDRRQSPPTSHAQQFARVQNKPAESVGSSLEASGQTSASPGAPTDRALEPTQSDHVLPEGPPAAISGPKNPPENEPSKEKESKSVSAVQNKPPAKSETVKPVAPNPVIEQNVKVMDEALSGKQTPLLTEPKSTGSEAGAEQWPSLKSLPANIQKEIPRITLSLLVYSNSSAERMVNVNGKMAREGEEVAPGLKLEQITQSGVVFNFKGTRFVKGIF